MKRIIWKIILGVILFIYIVSERAENKCIALTYSESISLSDIAYYINQCGDTGFDITKNSDHVNEFFETNPAKGTLIKSNPAPGYSIALNAQCWQEAKFDSGSSYTRKIEQIIDIKSDGVYINNKLKEDTEENADNLRRAFYIYFNEFNPNYTYGGGVKNDGVFYDGSLKEWIKYQCKLYLFDSGGVTSLFNQTVSDWFKDTYDITRVDEEYEEIEYRIVAVGSDSRKGSQPYMLFAARKSEDSSKDKGRIRVIKHDKNYPTIRLNGAKFVLYNEDKKGYVSKDNEINDESDYYKLPDKVIYTNKKSDAYKFETGGPEKSAKGYLTIHNVPIPFNKKSGHYRLEEVEAAEGYKVKDLSDATIELTVNKTNDKGSGMDTNRQSYLLASLKSYGITKDNVDKTIYDLYAHVSDWTDDEKLQAQKYIARVMEEYNKKDHNFYPINNIVKDSRVLIVYSKTIGYSCGKKTTGGNAGENSNIYGSLRIIKTSKTDNTKVIGNAKYVLSFEKDGKTRYVKRKENYEAMWDSETGELQTYDNYKESKGSLYEDAVFTTNDKGIIDIKNLDTRKTYTLTEIGAPDGYSPDGHITGIKVRPYANDGEYKTEYLINTLKSMTSNIGNNDELDNVNKEKILKALYSTINDEEKVLEINTDDFTSTTKTGLINEWLFENVHAKVKYSDNNLEVIKQKRIWGEEEGILNNKTKRVKFLTDFYNSYKNTKYTVENVDILVYEPMIKGWTTAKSVETEIPKAGTLKIYKKDAEYHKPLEGVGFTIKNISIDDGYDKTKVGKYVTGDGKYGNTYRIFNTDSDGIIEVKDLIPGEYNVEEVRLKAGVQQEIFNIGCSKTVSVTAGDTAKGGTTKGDYSIENYHEYGLAQLLKIDGMTGKKLYGFKFKIYDAQERKWVKFNRTSVNGKTVYKYSGLTDYIKDGSSVVTESDGYTLIMLGLQLKHRYMVYELGGDNLPYYPINIGDKSVYTSDLYEDLFETINFKDKGGSDGDVKNIRYCGSLTVQKVKDYELANNKFSNLTVQKVITNSGIGYPDIPEPNNIENKSYTLVEETSKMEIKGFVFDDEPSAKNSQTVNNEYNAGTDKPLKGVPVEAQKNGSNIGEKNVQTNTNGEYKMTLDITEVIREINNNDKIKSVKIQIDALNANNNYLYQTGLQKIIRQEDKIKNITEYKQMITEWNAQLENYNALQNEARKESSVLDYSAEINDLEDKIDEKQERINVLKEEINELKTEVDDLQKQIDTNYKKARQKAEDYKTQYNTLFDTYIKKFLEDVKVIFTYNGVTYENVAQGKVEDVSKENATTHNKAISLAAEDNKEREDFNKKFEVITGEGQEILNEKVNYVVETDGAGNEIRIKTNNKFPIKARTYESCVHDRYENLKAGKSDRVELIDRINLGVTQRAMPNMLLYNSLSQVEASINGKTFVYKPGVENEDFKSATDLLAQFQKKPLVRDQKVDDYGVPLYPSDLYYTDSTNKENELNYSVTYKIKVENASVGLITKVNSIDIYYPEKYTYDGIYDNGGHSLTVTVDDLGHNTDGEDYDNYEYNGSRITFNNSYFNINTTDNNSKEIYVKFKLPPDQLKSIGEEIFGDTQFRTRAEISSYSVYKGGKPYAGFDYMSIPGNYFYDYTSKPKSYIDINGRSITKEKLYDSVAKYEADTDDARGFKFVRVGNRTISGTVFEDGIVTTTGVGGERKGNGNYDSGETKIENVSVTLYDKNTGNVAELYNYDDKGVKTEERNIKTNANGSYTITGIIPGDYYVQFTWGDNDKYNPAKYKSTIISDSIGIGEFNGDPSKWYITADSSSDAIDNAGERINYDSNMLDTSKFDDLNPEVDFKGTINAKTRNMDIGIENTTSDHAEEITPRGFEVHNINLGIVERPIQDLEIDKRISHVKFTDAQGRVLADSEVDADGKLTQTALNYVVSLPASESEPFGLISAEVDYYPIEVEATYIIEVKNNSEKDYYNNETQLANYYYYGTVGPNDKLIKLHAENVYDYMNEKFDLKDVTGSEENKVVSTSELIEAGETETVIERGYDDYTNSYDNYVSETYEDIYGNTIDEESWRKNIGEVTHVYEQWEALTETTTMTTRSRKLNQKDVVNLKTLENELEPGSSQSVDLIAISTIAATVDDVDLSNDAEITDIERNQNFGRTTYKTHTSLYDPGQRITVTPPKGENRDRTPMYIIIISSVVALTAIGVGIIVIKKKKHSNK